MCQEVLYIQSFKTVVYQDRSQTWMQINLNSFAQIEIESYKTQQIEHPVYFHEHSFFL